ncbi:MAG: AAA family ATPase [Gammaproteobacteria bacterium]|nr:AAA family ATPase [Gammaproteobacteria bacterium]
MAIRIDARELHLLLSLTPAKQNILLVGKHGIGKSEIITRFYREEMNLQVVSFFLGQMSDPGDLIGLLHKDEASGRSLFLPPYWWPAEGQPIVLFLDELNRARPEILQAVQDLTLNRTLAGKSLPEGSIIVSAVNEGDEYQLTDLDPALVSRFNVYEFAPTAEDWLVWATAHEVDERVVTFIQKHHEFLDDPPALPETAVAGLAKTPDRRAWVKVSDFLKQHAQTEDIHIKIVAGMVGSPAAAAFREHLSASLISPEQILLQFSKYRGKVAGLPLHVLVMLNERILLWLNSRHCPEDQTDKARKNLLAYLKLLKKAGQQEVLAHFTSLAQNPKFEQAMAFIAESMPLIEFLAEYLEGINVK